MFPWRENKILKKALSLYAGDHVLAHVLRHGEDALEFSNTNCEVTPVFIDIAGFTTAREGLTQQDLMDLLRSWFELLSSQISGHGGAFDAIVGDAVSAWWGPDSSADPPLAACQCAKRIVSELSLLNERNRSKRWPQFNVGIGINTGIVSLGSYGSSRRLRYAPLGDHVNLASRLCGMANRDYPHPIVISAHTQERLNGKLETQLLEAVNVKGREGKLDLFTI
jgi:adenylate cyclase